MTYEPRIRGCDGSLAVADYANCVVIYKCKTSRNDKAERMRLTKKQAKDLYQILAVSGLRVTA